MIRIYRIKNLRPSAIAMPTFGSVVKKSSRPLLLCVFALNPARLTARAGKNAADNSSTANPGKWLNRR
jgi:hypothetical protein